MYFCCISIVLTSLKGTSVGNIDLNVSFQYNCIDKILIRPWMKTVCALTQLYMTLKNILSIHISTVVIIVHTHMYTMSSNMSINGEKHTIN